MTYQELLTATAAKKLEAIREINTALKGPAGFLIEAEIKRGPGKYAWSMLGREFCETLADHVEEFIEATGGIDSLDAREIGSIYMAYEDGNPDIYYMLPVEAQLFEE